MARGAGDVLAELLAIGPPGIALPQDPDSLWAVWLGPLADAVASLEQMQDSLVHQVDPRVATDLLADFERVLGPDPLGRDAGAVSIGQRQSLAFQRWTFSGGCSPDFYIALAASMGITITIQDRFTSSQCGATVCGDQLGPPGDELTWLITMPATTETDAICGVSECGDALGSFAPNPLEPLITYYAQPLGGPRVGFVQQHFLGVPRCIFDRPAEVPGA
jgi:uncharacterized protein YmfQ (DUF2313 family)